jgi:hypothetical protein
MRNYKIAFSLRENLASIEIANKVYDMLDEPEEEIFLAIKNKKSLIGEDGNSLFPLIMQNAKFIILILSSEYGKTGNTRLESRHISGRFQRERTGVFVIKTDDSALPDYVNGDYGYCDYNKDGLSGTIKLLKAWFEKNSDIIKIKSQSDLIRESLLNAKYWNEYKEFQKSEEYLKYAEKCAINFLMEFKKSFKSTFEGLSDSIGTPESITQLINVTFMVEKRYIDKRIALALVFCFDKTGPFINRNFTKQQTPVLYYEFQYSKDRYPDMKSLDKPRWIEFLKTPDDLDCVTWNHGTNSSYDFIINHFLEKLSKYWIAHSQR